MFATALSVKKYKNHNDIENFLRIAFFKTRSAQIYLLFRSNGWDKVLKIAKISTFMIIYYRSEKATDITKIEMSLMH